MERSAKIVVGVVVVGALLLALWGLVSFAGLQTSLIWTAIIGAAAWVIRSSIEQKREHQKLLATRKQEHYLQFLQLLAKYISPSDEAHSQASNETSSAQSSGQVDELRMWSLRLTLIGSDEVVREWNAARIGSHDPDNPLSTMKSWGRLWLAMRRDSGHLDTKLGITDVLASFVNDIEKSRSALDNKPEIAK